ncbi:hypothetical protein BOX15_Mlig022600g1, partial [Macrostomum lignano]
AMRRKPVISLRGPVPRPPPSPPSPLEEQPQDQQQQPPSRSISLLPRHYEAKKDTEAKFDIRHSSLLLLRGGDNELKDIDQEDEDDDEADIDTGASGGGCSLAPLDLSIKDGAAGKGFASPQPEPLRPSPSAAGASGASAAATRLACTACDREFFDRSTLNRHVRTVHSGCKPHRCELCGKGFARADYLRKHYTTHAAGQGLTAQPAIQLTPPPPPLHSPAVAHQQPQNRQQQQQPPPPPPLSPEVANALKAIWLQHKLLTAGPSAPQL